MSYDIYNPQASSGSIDTSPGSGYTTLMSFNRVESLPSTATHYAGYKDFSDWLFKPVVYEPSGELLYPWRAIPSGETPIPSGSGV